MYDYDGMHPFMVVEQDEDNPSVEIYNSEGDFVCESFEEFVKECKFEHIFPVNNCEVDNFEEFKILQQIEFNAQFVIKAFILYGIDDVIEKLKKLSKVKIEFKYYTQNCPKGKSSKEANRIKRRFSNEIKPYLKELGLTMYTEDLDNSTCWSNATTSWCKVVICQ